MKYKVIPIVDTSIKIIDGDRGKNYPQKDQFSHKGFCLFLNTKNVTSRGFVFNEVSFISKERDELLRKGKLVRNDIVLTTRGTVGNFGYYNSQVEFENIRINSGMVIIRNEDPSINTKYLYWLLRSSFINNQIKSLVSGSAQPQLPISSLKKINLIIPPMEIQNFIASIIVEIEEKINTIAVINKKIEKITQLIFKQWFIDFEFPNEQGLPYNSSGGKMVESELGIIPEGWNVKSVADISEIMSGGTPRTSIEEYWNGSIPFFTPKDVDSSYYAIFTEKHVTEAGLAKCASKLYPIDTIFITARGTVGKLALAGTEMAMNQSCYALKHKSEYQYYLYLQLNKLMRNIIQSSNGAVFNAINVKDFNSYKLPYATNEVLENFEAEVAPLFKMILNLSKENDELSKLRDTLLPKLLSGEIEIPVLEPERV